MPAPAGPAGGRLSPRSPGAPGPARPPCDARTAPGRCHQRPATARPPAGCQTGPSRRARPSYRTLPGHIPGSAAAQALHRAPPPGERGAQSPAAGGARAAWWLAAHPAPPRRPPARPPRAAQPPVTCTLTAPSHPSWQYGHRSPAGTPCTGPGTGTGCRPQTGPSLQHPRSAIQGPAAAGRPRLVGPGQRHLRARCGHRRFHSQRTFR